MGTIHSGDKAVGPLVWAEVGLEDSTDLRGKGV